MEAQEGAAGSIELLCSFLDEQRGALRELDELYSATPGDAELATVRAQLQKTISELEEAVGQPEEISSHPSDQDGPTIGERYRFRYTDGRWYDGVAEGISPTGVSIRFLRPTMAHMLAPAIVDPGLLKPRRLFQPAQLTPGCLVLAAPRPGQLWESAEVVSASSDSVRVVLQATGATADLRLGSVAISAYASDSSRSSSEAEACGAMGAEADDAASDGTESESADSDRPYGELPESATAGVAGAAATPARSATAGRQTDTISFAAWEEHTRGIASKLMAHMGYTKGAGLGRPGRGRADPIQVQVYRPQAGLGSEGSNLGNAEYSSNRRKRRGGLKARRKRQAEAAFAARNALRDAEHRAELETGAAGVFALVNRRLGDGSEGARLVKASEERASGRMRRGASGAFGAGDMGPAATPLHSRKTLATAREDLAAARAKVSKLQEMGRRNKKDIVIAKQVAAKLAEAQAKLASLESSQESDMAALQSREKHKKWLKF